MAENDFIDIPSLPREATKFIMDKIISCYKPLIARVHNAIQLLYDEIASKLCEVFTLCLSQIIKCLMSLFEIFRLEYSRLTYLKESRQCTLDRLSWCYNRLVSLDNYLQKTEDSEDVSMNESFNINNMYFVNWIDHTFEILNKLSELVYKTDYKDSEESFDNWKSEMVECISSLHISIDELLLCAMTLCKYSLPADQTIVKARCQVVLRETKALLSELMNGDMNTSIKPTTDTLKLPLMPSNVNVLIDVLKDVLYVLETNTNTALLALLINCFSCARSPVDLLKDHFKENRGLSCISPMVELKGNYKEMKDCLSSGSSPTVELKENCVSNVISPKENKKCFSNNHSPLVELEENLKENKDCPCSQDEDGFEDCPSVAEFDLYNERLLQIGAFAVSCSSDQNRILSLRSGLASLEALDPHLVPALMTSPDSYHSILLIKLWKKEVQDIRNSVFLIVDPAAFADKSKQMMHQKLLETLNETTYNNVLTCSVIDIGCVVYDFFNVYIDHEPEALTQKDKLLPLLADLDKVQKECKIVSNLLSSRTDFKYAVQTSKNKEISLEQLYKRLKLFYTLINRINSLLQPKEDNLFDNETEELAKNLTHTIIKNGIGNTYVNSPKKNNLTRSLFARTYVRSSTRNFPLGKLTKHLRNKNCSQLNFSIQLDRLLNESDESLKKSLIKVKERSILYNFSPIKNRSSLRKVVLNRHLQSAKKGVKKTVDEEKVKDSLMDENDSLQLTQVLNEMTEMTSFLSTKNHQTSSNILQPSNITKVNVNCDNTNITKRIWNIPVNATTVDIPLYEESVENVSNMTHPSDVNTLKSVENVSNLTYPSDANTLESVENVSNLTYPSDVNTLESVENVSNLTHLSDVNTLERISDLDFVESKLNSLKSQYETSL